MNSDNQESSSEETKPVVTGHENMLPEVEPDGSQAPRDGKLFPRAVSAAAGFSERFFGRLSGAGAPMNTHLLAAKGKQSSAEVDETEFDPEVPRHLDTRMHTAEFAALTTEDLEEDPEGQGPVKEPAELPKTVGAGAVAIGGALGATLRYTLSLLFPVVMSVQVIGFEWPMLIANLLGCLIIGFVVGGLEVRPTAPAWIRPLVVTGFCGGFTTVSAFGVYIAALMGGGFSETALLYGGVTIGFCVLVCIIGLVAGRKIFTETRVEV